MNRCYIDTASFLQAMSINLQERKTMLLIITLLFVFIVPIFLPKLVQKYGILEIPNQVPYESVLAVSSGRSYGMCQAATGCFGVLFCSIFKCIESLSDKNDPFIIIYFFSSVVFFLLSIFFALFVRNWAFILCTDGIVQRTAFGKICYYILALGVNEC